ncbi:MAG: hypothetical protein QW713_06020 [Sulfolobales archaeon]
MWLKMGSGKQLLISFYYNPLIITKKTAYRRRTMAMIIIFSYSPPPYVEMVITNMRITLFLEKFKPNHISLIFS